MDIEINNSIVENPLKDKKQWLLWKAKPKNGSEKFDKIPYYATNLKLRKGVQGSEEDVKNLVDFETAYRFASENPEFGLGFALLPNDNIVGVDFDNCIVDGVINDEVQMVMDLLGGYWEVSPSGKGVRGLFKGKTKTIRTKKVEIYSGVQFLTITGNVVPGSTFDLVQFDVGTLSHLFDLGSINGVEAEPSSDFDVATHKTISFNSADGDMARECLNYIDPDCSYSDWMSVACAMKYRFGDDADAEQAFVDWSSKGQKFISESDCSNQYKRMDSIKHGDNITFGTLMSLAREGGLPETKKTVVKPKTLEANEEYLLNSLQKNKDGKVLGNRTNVRLAVQYSSHIPRLFHDISGTGYYWHTKPSWSNTPPIKYAHKSLYPLDLDYDWGYVDELLITEYGIYASDSDIKHALKHIPTKNPVNLPQEVFNEKVPEWDGINRIDTWLIKYLDVEDNAYTRAISEKVLCTGIRRMFHPGSSVHASLIIEGGQGFGKTTLVNKLALGMSYSDDINIKDKDTKQALQKAWIVELAELAFMNSTKSEDMKGFMSRSSDTFRLPYGSATKEYPRSFIMIGTTNDGSYLKDQTGNRRYWPVKAGSPKLNFKEFEEVVPQLWAEAKLRHYAKYPNIDVDIYLDGEAKLIAETQQGKRLAANPLVDAIIDFILTKKHKSFFENATFFDEAGKDLSDDDFSYIDFVTIRDIMSIDYVRDSKSVRDYQIAHALTSLEGIEKFSSNNGRRRVKRYGSSILTCYMVDIEKFREKYEGN